MNANLQEIHDSIHNFRIEEDYQPNDMVRLLAILERIVIELKRLGPNPPPLKNQMLKHRVGRWELISLDDGSSWLTDGTNGFAPDASLDLLAAAKRALNCIRRNGAKTRFSPVEEGIMRDLELAIAKATEGSNEH